MNKKDFEAINWAVHNLKTRYEDSKKALKVAPDWVTALENVKQYENLLALQKRFC